MNIYYKKRQRVKRVFDVALSVLVLPFFFLVVSIVFTLQYKSTGIFYIQKRVGLNKKGFYIYKFKTMVDSIKSMELNSDGVVKIKNDNRITKLGKFMRYNSIDEIPQIINIIKGDMSWVGPRPLVEIEFDSLSEIQKNRITVIPGLTGLAQINGRAALNLSELAQFDLEYIENYSFALDLLIMYKSIKIVLRKENCF